MNYQTHGYPYSIIFQHIWIYLIYVFLFFFHFIVVQSWNISHWFTLIYKYLQYFTMFPDVSWCFQLFPYVSWILSCSLFLHVFSCLFHVFPSRNFVSSTNFIDSSDSVAEKVESSLPKRVQCQNRNEGLGAWQPRPCTVHHKSMCQDSHGFSSARLERPRHDPEKRHWSQALDFLLMSKPTSIDTQSDTGSQHGSAAETMATWPVLKSVN